MTNVLKTGIPSPTPANTDKVMGVVVQVVDQLQGVRGSESQRAVRLFELQELEARLNSEAIGDSVAGTVDATEGYIHNQTSASDTWTINHNLGRRVSVSVFSTGGVEMWAQVLTVDVNQVKVLFDGPFAGYAVIH